MNRVHRMWREYRGLLLFLVMMSLFRSVIADWNTVPTGSMKPTILEGDRSADSRVYGFVPRDEIVGRSDTVVVSLNYDNYYLPRSERWWQALP